MNKDNLKRTEKNEKLIKQVKEENLKAREKLSQNKKHKEEKAKASSNPIVLTEKDYRKSKQINSDVTVMPAIEQLKLEKEMKEKKKEEPETKQLLEKTLLNELPTMRQQLKQWLKKNPQNRRLISYLATYIIFMGIASILFVVLGILYFCVTLFADISNMLMVIAILILLSILLYFIYRFIKEPW